MKPEQHRASRMGWLRAAVLGANDGILSTASLIVGVAAAQASKSSVLVAGVAGLVAGAMSMAAGEYVSVSSQADTERADLVTERKELDNDDESEHKELALIYEGRGLDPLLAKQVAEQLMAHDALAANCGSFQERACHLSGGAARQGHSAVPQDSAWNCRRLPPVAL